MATLIELKAEILAEPVYKDFTAKEWDTKSVERGIDHKFDHQLNAATKFYVEELSKPWRVFTPQPEQPMINVETLGKLSRGEPLDIPTYEQIISQWREEVKHEYDHRQRCRDKLVACVKELELRKAGTIRELRGTEYYIDLDNGSDSAAGTRLPATLTYAADAGTNTTTIVDTQLDGATIVAGDFVWNVTRGLSQTVQSWTDATDTIVLNGAIAGQTTGDTYYLLRAWLTANKYTTTTVRSVGDIAWVRANTSIAQGAEAVDIGFDESGTTAARIEIRGCQKEATQTGYDKWSDVSDVLPIVDFEDAAYQANLDMNYWKIENMEFRQSADLNGQIYVSYVIGNHLKNCKINDGGNSGTEGVFLVSCNVTIENCTFIDTWGPSIYGTSGTICTIVNCILNKGTVRASSYGVRCDYGSFFEVVGSSFGQTTAFATNDILCSISGRVYLRNCLTNSSYSVATMGRIYIEDDDGTYQSHQAIFQSGTVSRDTSVTRPGGASSSLKYAPVSGCTTNFPLWARDKDLSGTFQLYLAAGVAKTITIYIRGYTWSTWPTAAQLFCEASYLSNAASSARTIVTSTQVLTDNTTWTAFTMTMTPARSGIVYVDVKLGLYTASCGINVDLPDPIP